jgi:serine/threonine protein kinase
MEPSRISEVEAPVHFKTRRSHTCRAQVLGSPATWGKGLPDAGIIKLCDFGLCADISGGHELTDFVGSPGFFAPELFCEASYRGDLADAWSLGSVVLECVLGHRAFDDLWCPPYDDLKDPNAFRDAVDAAVGRVKLGGPNGPLPPKLSSLVSNLLRVDPKIRPPRCFNVTRPTTNLPVHVHPGATVTDMCSRPEFDLMRPDKDGCMSMLRLTYDHTRMSRSLFNFHAIDATRRDAIRVSPLRHRRDTCQRTTSAQRASRRTQSPGAKRSPVGVL